MWTCGHRHNIIYPVFFFQNGQINSKHPEYGQMDEALDAYSLLFIFDHGHKHASQHLSYLLAITSPQCPHTPTPYPNPISPLEVYLSVVVPWPYFFASQGQSLLLVVSLPQVLLQQAVSLLGSPSQYKFQPWLWNVCDKKDIFYIKHQIYNQMSARLIFIANRYTKRLKANITFWWRKLLLCGLSLLLISIISVTD